MFYLLTAQNNASEFLDELEFNPLDWLGTTEPIDTMGDLFRQAGSFEGRDPESKYIRYCDEDVCFEISFDYLKNGIKDILDNQDPYGDVYIYAERTTSGDKFYILDAAGEF